MALSTRARVSGRTDGWSLSTRDTVWWDRPRVRATSAIVAARKGSDIVLMGSGMAASLPALIVAVEVPGAAAQNPADLGVVVAHSRLGARFAPTTTPRSAARVADAFHAPLTDP